VIFKDFFPGPSRTKVIFKNVPEPEILQEKIHDFPGGVGTLAMALGTSYQCANMNSRLQWSGEKLQVCTSV